MKRLAIGLAVIALVWSSAVTDALVEKHWQKVDPSEFSFIFEASLKSVSGDSDGNIVSIDGKVEEFRLRDRGSIELETDKILMENGNALIHTKEYGKIRITMDSLLRTSIWLTPDQRRRFKELVQ